MRRLSCAANLLVIVLCGAGARADTVAGTHTIDVDDPAFIRLHGQFHTDDEFPFDGVNGNFLVINAVHWQFEVEHIATGWVRPDNPNPRALNVQIGMQGVHKVGPHESDIPNNPLPLIKSMPPNDVPVDGAGRNLVAMGATDHPTASGEVHRDAYGMIHLATATLPTDPPVARLSGPYVIVAKHAGKTPTLCFSEGTTWGSRRSGQRGGTGSTVSFISDGAGGGFLRFSAGAIDILDREGGLSGGIDPDFASDPVRGGTLLVEDMPFLGKQADGRFKFAGGHLALTDPAANFALQAKIGDYFVSNTTDQGPLSSFGLLDSLGVTDVEAASGWQSPFLQEFSETHVLGEGLTPDAFANEVGIDFSFVTGSDLAAATGGFSHSVMDLPATLLCTGNSVPEPSTALIFALGLCIPMARVPRGSPRFMCRLKA